MALQADEILASQVWRQALETINEQIWAEHTSTPLGDVEGLLRIHYRRWAIQRIAAALEDLMRDPQSPNRRMTNA